MTGHPSLRSVAVIYNRTKMDLRSSFGLWIAVYHQEKPSQELKAGTEAETKQEHCLLNCSTCFLYSSGPHAPGITPLFWVLGPSVRIINQENSPLDLPRGHFLN